MKIIRCNATVKDGNRFVAGVVMYPIKENEIEEGKARMRRMLTSEFPDYEITVTTTEIITGKGPAEQPNQQ